VVSVVSFSTRLSQMELDQIYSILNSAYGFVLTPTARALKWMSDPNSYIGNSLVDVMPLLQYYLHGLFEFGLLWQRPDTQEFQFGMQHFAPYFKVLGILGLSNYSEAMLEDAYYRVGVFTTFFGPLWIDFGWLGPLVMGAFGVFCAYCAALARKGVGEVIPLYAYLCVVLFFMPVTNLIVNAQGMYILNALLLLWILGRHSRAASAVPGMIANRGYGR
jgi:oligosaccharide repeat unit polymerase